MIKTFPFRPVRKASLERCVEWCRENFHLRDWSVELKLGEVTEDEVAHCDLRRTSLSVDITVSPQACRSENRNMLSVVIHEMLHTLMEENGIDDDEQVVSVLEPLIYQLYCRAIRRAP